MIAAAANHGRWQPQGDDALIELRARDVGTSRNPLIGQPSTSGTYGGGAANVAHPGPLGFVVLAPGVRLLGTVTGTLVSIGALSAASMLVVAWLLFRHLGPRGGAAGAVLVSLVAFSSGAAGLVDPLSSNLGRLPLLAACVAVWALLCGDLRVAPLAAGFWTFAAQQHLSVLPAAAVLGGVGVAGSLWWVWRADPGERRAELRWVGLALGVGVVGWLPVLWQEVTGDPGNLTALWRYAGDGGRRDLGLRSALDQVANALGPRPFLGRSSPVGWDLVAHRSTLGVLATLVVVGSLAGAGAWWRRSEPRFVAAVAMVGVVALGALLTGRNIPDSPEQGRINFFHWAFALSFFELLVIGWLLARVIPVLTPRLTHGRPITALAVAAVVVFAVALTPLVADRPSDRLAQPLLTPVVDDLLGQLRHSSRLDAVEGPLLVLVDGDDRYIQVGDTVGAHLVLAGRPVVFPPSSAGFVHPDRIADPCIVRDALVISLVRGDRAAPPGVEVASVDAAPGLDRPALHRLVAQAAGQRVELGAGLEAALAALPGDQGALVGATMAYRLGSRTEEILLVRSNLDLLIAHPPTSPVLDRRDLIALRRSLPSGAAALAATDVTAHLLDRAELERFRPDLFAAC